MFDDTPIVNPLPPAKPTMPDLTGPLVLIGTGVTTWFMLKKLTDSNTIGVIGGIIGACVLGPLVGLCITPRG